MRHFAQLIIAAAALAMPFSASAQSSIEKALDTFVSSNDGSRILSNNGRQDRDNGKTCTYNSYEFEVSKKDAQWLQLRKAFDTDAKNAYNVFVKNNGATDQSKSIIGFGPDPASSSSCVTFGTHSSHNYRVLLFRDPTDELWRTCYALAWYDAPDNDNKVHGYAYKIYSRDPQIVGNEQQRTTVAMLNDGSVVQYDNNTGRSTIMQAGTSHDDNDNIKSSTDFLARFNNMRALYIKNNKKGNISADKMPIMTSIVNKIMSMCKQYGKMLNSDEKQVVVNTLHSMMQDCEDIGLNGMLGLAAKYLK